MITWKVTFLFLTVKVGSDGVNFPIFGLANNSDRPISNLDAMKTLVVHERTHTCVLVATLSEIPMAIVLRTVNLEV